MLNGIIIVKKEPGFTSNDVVAKMRGICKQKKIGHTGTLDPDATGVLPVCLGTGTKLCDMLTERDKEYVAELLLGVSTDTQDISGTVLEERPVTATQEQVREAALSFVGPYDQIPPMYSALKVNGKKLYELAREGKEIERKARRVEILELEILDMQLPVVKLRVCCTKGTYIRTLCADIGEKLGCGGTMKSLVRTKVGRFTLEQAHTLSELEKIRDEGLEKQAPEERAAGLESVLIPTEIVFEDLKRVCTLPEADKYLLNGNAIPAEKTVIKANATAETKANGAVVGNVADGGLAGNLDGAAKKVTGSIRNGERVRMYTSEGNFLGVFEYSGHERSFRPVKMFL
ncbi:MAG: tRNA pseudouridine(55) synthase TruB [Lachnospiraceae bacterium]|nr:tRNA pseudouridine(55) synthase TruB [Lachnospiraceae bacterium]